MTTISESQLKYLEDPAVRNNDWVREVIDAKDAEKLSMLFWDRIHNPYVIGPKPRDVEDTAIIISDLVSNQNIDQELFEKAMVCLFEKINAGTIFPKLIEMEDIFDILWNQCPNDVSPHLFEWLKEHQSYMNSLPIEEKTFMNGLRTYAIIQSGDDGALEMWQALWDKEDPKSADIAFWGLRYLDVTYALAELPKLVERKCPEMPQIIQSLLSAHEPDHIEAINRTVKQALVDNDTWFGEAINAAVKNLSVDSKKILMNRLNEALKIPDENVEASSSD